MKVVFMLFLFGMLFRFAGGGPWGRRWSDHDGHHGPPWADRGRWADHHRDRTASRSTTRGPTGHDLDDEADDDWEEAVRAAKREIDRLFPDPKE
jgi:hypothetical protein